MIRLAVSVEGRTETEFVKRILGNHLRGKGIDPTPVALGRGRGAGGGNVGVERLTLEMSRLHWHFDAVTSLVDYYGFRDKGERTVDELEEHLIEQIQQRISRHWDPTKIIPYVQRHEFEGLLFSDVSAFAILADAPPNLVEALRQIRSQFQTPEDINDNRDTAPSKRILRLMPRYSKIVAASRLVEEMGIDVIRAECHRFHRWVTRLESLPPTSSTKT